MMITKEYLGQLTSVTEYTHTASVIYVDVDPDVIEAFLRTVFGEGEYYYDEWVNTTFTIKREVKV